MTIENPIHWLGSKKQLIPELRRYLPAEMSRIIEPCCGAGHFTLAFGPTSAVWNDTEAMLIQSYVALQSMAESGSLSDFLRSMTAQWSTYEQNEQARWHALNTARRCRFFDNRLDVLQAFCLLNQASYSGLMRWNQKGIFNSPLKRPQNIRASWPNKLHNLAQFFAHRVEFSSMDVLEFLKRLPVGNGEWIVCDPPYYKSWSYGQVWDEAKYKSLHRELLDCYQRRNYHVVYFNSPNIQDLWPYPSIGHGRILKSKTNWSRENSDHFVFIA